MLRKRMFRAAALVGLLAAAASLGGCSWKYLYPGRSFTHDEEWERQWAQKDTAEKDMPQYIKDGAPTLDQNWDAIFPGAQDDNW